LKNIEDLDRKALEEGFKEIEQEYTGKTLLNQLKTFYITYSIPRSYSKSLLPSRGMLLYGPPGTGKTTLTDTLPTKIGLT
jgi:SpoVK/Ycf46/Vps4 family AAA+-type ATPase